MTTMIKFIRQKLSRKILIVLTLSVAMVMSGVIFLTVNQETKEMLKEVDAGSDDLTNAIYAGIKYPMSVGDNNAVERQMIDIKEKMPDVEIFICDSTGRIVFCSHPERLRSDVGKYIANQNALSALGQVLKTGEQPSSVFEEQQDGRHSLVHLHAIMNQPECHRCHGSAKTVIGATVLRKSVDRNYAAIAGLRNSNIFISLLGIAAFVSLAHALLSRMVSKPIERLANDIRTLPAKISSGAELSIADSDRTDEVGVLQNTFNHMTNELVDKTRAIERSSSQLEKANKELEAFAYSVSHDLRAPLRNIDGFSKILLDDHADQLDDQAKHYLKRVRNGTIRMSELIDDMLTFSRIGRSELRLRRVQCRNIIDAVLENYSEKLENKKITVTVGELPAIYCDPVLMQSLFANLISNAMKFSSHAQQPHITIGYERRQNVFFVKDNGIGFDMQYHDKIFQVFQRLHLPEEYEGTGIGLAIVQRIAERHQGKIWAESSINNGATFYIQLPTSQEE